MKKTTAMKLSREETVVRMFANKLIKKGCPPEEIRISGIQNVNLKNWAEKKGVIWDKKQGCDISYPGEYDFRG